MKKWEELNSFVQWVCIISFFLMCIMVFAGFFYLLINDPGEYILGMRAWAQDWFYLKNPDKAAEVEALGYFGWLPFVSIILVGGLILFLLFSSYLELRGNEKEFKRREINEEGK